MLKTLAEFFHALQITKQYEYRWDNYKVADINWSQGYVAVPACNLEFQHRFGPAGEGDANDYREPDWDWGKNKIHQTY